MFIRRLVVSGNKKKLVPETQQLAAMDVEGAEFYVWGVVTYVIHQV
jgi:SOS-response transcriptional repressor LexA